MSREQALIELFQVCFMAMGVPWGKCPMCFEHQPLIKFLAHIRERINKWEQTVSEETNHYTAL